MADGGGQSGRTRILDLVRVGDLCGGERAGRTGFRMNCTIAIPTFGRGQVLVDTLRRVLASGGAAELLVVDQNQSHDHEVESALRQMHEGGLIQWLRLPTPSVTAAMNVALVQASQEIVIFLDDDVIPEPGLVDAHLVAYKTPEIALVAGRVIQPWQEGQDFSKDRHFHFASLWPAFGTDFIGCNFSARKEFALAVGGFDENFVRVAYNYEAEFSHRLRAAGFQTFYTPAACVHHLKAGAGGTRTYGNHLRTLQPDHSVGAYYFIIRTWHGWRSLKALLRRPMRAVATRHHLRKPWWIPLTLIGEIRGVCWAAALAWKGPKLLHAEVGRSSS